MDLTLFCFLFLGGKAYRIEIDSDFDWEHSDNESNHGPEVRPQQKGQNDPPQAAAAVTENVHDRPPPPAYKDVVSRRIRFEDCEEDETVREALDSGELAPRMNREDYQSDSDGDGEASQLPSSLPTLDSDEEETLSQSQSQSNSQSQSQSQGDSVYGSQSSSQPISQPSSQPGSQRKSKRQKEQANKRRKTAAAQPSNTRRNEVQVELDDYLEAVGCDKDWLPICVYRDLVAGKALTMSMKRIARESKKSKMIIQKIVEAEEVSGSGSTTRVKKEVGLNARLRLDEATMSQPLFEPRKKPRRVEKYEVIREKAISFYMDDQTSRACPGKNDYVRLAGGEKLQKRICNDYIKNLHERFMLENPECRCSFNFFYQQRPANVLTSKYLTKDTACCQKHQNFQLLMKALGKAIPNVKCLTSPDAFIEEYNTEDKIHELLNRFDYESDVSHIKYQEWGRVQDESDGKQKTRIIQKEAEVAQFMEDFLKKYVLFVKHASNATHQYRQQRRLKQNLKYGECIVQVDFIQNYMCLLADAAQSSFFDQTQVTIHASCVYFKRTPDGPVEHQSFVHVSPMNHHHAGMIRAILTQLWETDFKDMKEELNIKKVHYYSDSPFSQYRNKYMFDFVCEHERMFGMKATWDYFESGHGKGPCDGVGGTIKRMADQAIKHGAQIQNAEDFYEWGRKNVRAFIVRYISKDYFNQHTAQYLELDKTLSSVSGTKKIHAIRPGECPGTIDHRELSCHCLVDDDERCPCVWTTSSYREAEPEEELGQRNSALRGQLKIGDNCIVEFNCHVYLGRCMDIMFNDHVEFALYTSKGDHIRVQFKMDDNPRRVFLSMADFHICEDLRAHRRGGGVYLLAQNDLQIYTSMTDALN